MTPETTAATQVRGRRQVFSTNPTTVSDATDGDHGGDDAER
ncbi:hypothetical protein [Demequina maris]|nr:hypothetical protein [Demequina maris]